MRFVYLLVPVAALALTLAACNPPPKPIQEAPSDTLRVASLNVHYIILSQQTGPWSVGDWERRKGPLDQAFKALNADIIGFQEMESFARAGDPNVNLARDWLLAQNPGYAAGANGDANVFPSTQPIFYRTARVSLVDQGWYFFSDTPNVIYSNTYNGSYPAYASWALFETPQGQLRVVNLHTDFGSRSNRKLSLELVADRTAPWITAGERVMVIGDFNALRSSPLLRPLKDLGVRFPAVRGATYHLNRGLGLFGAIDHLGLGPGVEIIGPPQVIRQKFEGEWPTDHYPVTADVTLR